MSESFHNDKLEVKKRATELFIRRKANMQIHATLKIPPPFFKTLVDRTCYLRSNKLPVTGDN